jgi:hypothetical protein
MKKIFFASCLIAGLSASAGATIVIQDDFGLYSALGDLETTGGYTVSGGFGGVDVLGTRFNDDPAASPFGYSGKELRLSGNNTNVEKNFSTTADTTYYFSYSFNVAQTNGDSYVSFQEELGRSIRLGVDSDGTFGVGYGNTSDSTTQTAVSVGTEYFVIGSFNVTGGFWSIGANIYTGATLPSIIVEPGTWDHTASANGGGGLVEEVLFLSNRTDTENSFPTFAIESYRVGEDFADVVPEPSTYALMAGYLTLGLVLLRRRLRA